MGVKVEFNQELTLRAYGTENRRPDECLPLELRAGRIHPFFKEGQRIYCVGTTLDLHETKGNQQVSHPLAKIVIRELTHISEGGLVWTRGQYEVKEVYDRKE